ncbi:MAG TPA: hypothetical protein DEP72_00915 [Clostridiales bacterium]|nr:MAG: hypothetical protein A2Y18_05010 [Clostridiales bacterium GWD2_32_19]HCC06714.1 hypothetical protein [Clostridiales bacterium]
MIGKLWNQDNTYKFKYNLEELENARKDGFDILKPFLDDKKLYSSDKMFEFFANRIPDKGRMDIYNAYGINTYNPIEYLKITKGKLATDNISLEVVS